MRTRMYGGVGGRKTKVGGKPTFCFPPTRFLFLKCDSFGATFLFIVSQNGGATGETN